MVAASSVAGSNARGGVAFFSRLPCYHGNLVLGRRNRFTSAASGGLVAGELNAIQNFGASVSGGSGNVAAGIGTVVIDAQNLTDNNNFSIAPSPPFLRAPFTLPKNRHSLR